MVMQTVIPMVILTATPTAMLTVTETTPMLSALRIYGYFLGYFRIYPLLSYEFS